MPSTEGKKVVQVSCGQDHSAILLADGNVIFFGCDKYQQCSGLDYTGSQKVLQVSCGGTHSGVLFENGQVSFFGGNL